MKKIIKLFVFSLILLFAFSISLVNVNAYLTDTTESITNTFTIKQTQKYQVTFTYYYVDENDNVIQLKAPDINTYDEGTIINLGTNLDQTVDYSEVKYYVNDSLYTLPTYPVTGDVTIQETYYLNRYNITYNLEGGTLDNPINQYTKVTSTFDLPTPTRSGYTFVGWGEQKVIAGRSPLFEMSTEMENGVVYDTGSQGDHHIYIKDVSGSAYAINVDYNGTDRIMVFTDDLTADVEYSSDGTNWTRIENWVYVENVGYQYFTLSNGSYDINSGIADSDLTYDQFIDLLHGETITINETHNPHTIVQGSTGDVEVTAIWRANQTYTVTFNANVNNGQGIQGTMNPQTFVAGETQALNSNTFTRSGYRFRGWATSSRGSVVYTDGQEIVVTRNMTLYAVWERSYN